MVSPELARRHRARVGHLRRRAVVGDGRIVLGIGDDDRNRDQRRLRGDVDRCRRVDRLVVVGIVGREDGRQGLCLSHAEHASLEPPISSRLGQACGNSRN